MERRGTCVVCLRNVAITARGMVRQHMVPIDDRLPRWQNRHRDICVGSRLPALPDPGDEVADILAMNLAPDLKTLALFYNRMHQELCRQGIFCSAHQPAAGIIDAVRREQRERDAPSDYQIPL